MEIKAQRELTKEELEGNWKVEHGLGVGGAGVLFSHYSMESGFKKDLSAQINKSTNAPVESKS